MSDHFADAPSGRPSEASFRASAGQMVLRFENLEVVPALHKARVQFVAATFSGRALAPTEMLRHPVSQPSEPLGVKGLRLRAVVDEAPVSLVAVVLDEHGRVVGGRAFTVDEAPKVGKHTSHALELDCMAADGTGLVLRFLAKHPDPAPNSPIIGAPRAPPMEEQTRSEAGSSWLTKLMVRLNCRAPDANKIDG